MGGVQGPAVAAARFHGGTGSHIAEARGEGMTAFDPLQTREAWEFVCWT
jgi:hypothetical protein